MKNFIYHSVKLEFPISNRLLKSIVTSRVCSDEPRLIGGTRFIGEFKDDSFEIWRSNARSKRTSLKITGQFNENHHYSAIVASVSKDYSTIIISEIVILGFMGVLVLARIINPFSRGIGLNTLMNAVVISQSLLLISFVYEKFIEAKSILMDFEDEINRIINQLRSK